MFTNLNKSTGLSAANQPLAATEPSFMVEFKEQCTSHYELMPKEDSEEISSDGEFNDARRIKVYDEDASEVLQIEG